MLNPEQQLTEKSLQANFTEVQQAHFDRLMSELEQLSGGLGFAELKAKAEAGDKKTLQVMRDYVAKKEQIVEFIEKKEIPLVKGEIKENDEVICIDLESHPELYGKRFKVVSFGHGDDIYVLGESESVPQLLDSKSLARFHTWDELENGKVKYIAATELPGNVYTPLDMQSYKGISVGDKFKYKQDFVKSVGPQNVYVKSTSVEVIGFVEGHDVVVASGAPENYVAVAMKFVMPDGPDIIGTGRVDLMSGAFERIE